MCAPAGGVCCLLEPFLEIWISFCVLLTQGVCVCGGGNIYLGLLYHPSSISITNETVFLLYP